MFADDMMRVHIQNQQHNICSLMVSAVSPFNNVCVAVGHVISVGMTRQIRFGWPTYITVIWPRIFSFIMLFEIL